MNRRSPSATLRALVCLAVSAAWLLSVTLAAAATGSPIPWVQAGTPSPESASAGRDAPSPDECTGQRPPLEAIPTAAAPPPATPASPAASPTAFVPPSGDPADAETVAAVTATMRGNLACLNAGDTLASFAFYTDRFLAGLLADAGVPELRRDYYDALATPFALPPSRRTSLDAIEQIQVLGDGRVGALVTTTNVDRTVNYVVFAPGPTDGSFLIDETIPVEVTPATPAP